MYQAYDIVCNNKSIIYTVASVGGVSHNGINSICDCDLVHYSVVYAYLVQLLLYNTQGSNWYNNNNITYPYEDIFKNDCDNDRNSNVIMIQ